MKIVTKNVRIFCVHQNC